MDLELKNKLEMFNLQLDSVIKNFKKDLNNINLFENKKCITPSFFDINSNLSNYIYF